MLQSDATLETNSYLISWKWLKKFQDRFKQYLN